MTCKRGDIVVALFPASNLRTAKARPMLVVQADNLNTGMPQLVTAMITSKAGWKWDDVLPLAKRAGELITLERGGDRRVDLVEHHRLVTPA